ncbi:MAG: hypothetical protein RLZZ600_1096 [Actinomycetota bacterium]|jgi:hypothetical protein
MRDENGSILPLIIGGCALALALILGVSSATSLYLERKRLLTIADGAALVAAQSFDTSIPPRLTTAGAMAPVLSPSSVVTGAQLYFANMPAQGSHSVLLVSATSPDARTATIRVRSQWQPPVISYFFPAGFALEATASARSVFAG